MFGFILRLDADRQKRVGTNQLQHLLSKKTYKAVLANETKLNASKDYTSPFAPTIVRPAFYPTFLRATDVRSIFWRIKNHTDFHDLTRAYIDTDSNLVFEFEGEEKINPERVDALLNLLRDYAYFDVAFKNNTKNKVVFEPFIEEDYCEE